MRGSIKKRGTTWRARYYVDGVERQRSFATKGLATKFLNDQLAAVQRGEWVDPAAGDIRFAAYAEQWREQQHWRPNTAALVEGHIRLHLVPVLGALALARIRRSHVVAVVRRCSHDTGLSAGVTRAVVTTLRRILDAAVADRLIPANVARDKTISLPRDERPPAEVLSAEQVAAIAAAINPRYRALVVVMAASGLRPSEAFGLTLDRCRGLAERLGDGVVVELGARAPGRPVTLRVDRQADGRGGGFAPPKTASSVRDVSIPAAVAEVLADHVRQFGLGPDQLIFTTSTDRMIGRARASEIWTRATAGLALPTKATWHDLRHYHASSLLSEGISIAFVARRLGHGNPAITLRTYSHAMPRDEDRVLAAAEAIAARLA